MRDDGADARHRHQPSADRVLRVSFCFRITPPSTKFRILPLGARLRDARTYLKPPSGPHLPPHCPVPRIREAAIHAVLPHLPEDAWKRRGGLAIETAIHFSRSRTSGDSGSWMTRSSVFTGRHAVVLPQVNEALGAFLQPLVPAIIAPLLAEAEHHGAILRLDVPHITSAHQLAELMRATS